MIGVNAITIYLAARIIPFDRISGFFFGGIARQLESYSPSSGAVVARWESWLWNGSSCFTSTAGASS